MSKKCPQCGSSHYITTLMGFINCRNENDVNCCDCGWSGKAYELKLDDDLLCTCSTGSCNKHGRSIRSEVRRELDESWQRMIGG